MVRKNKIIRIDDYIRRKKFNETLAFFDSIDFRKSFTNISQFIRFLKDFLRELREM